MVGGPLRRLQQVLLGPPQVRPRESRNTIRDLRQDEGGHPCYLCGYEAQTQLSCWDQEPLFHRYSILLCRACIRSYKIEPAPPPPAPAYVPDFQLKPEKEDPEATPR